MCLSRVCYHGRQKQSVCVCVCQFLRRGTVQLWVLLSRADRDRRADRSGFGLSSSSRSNNVVQPPAGYGTQLLAPIPERTMKTSRQGRVWPVSSLMGRRENHGTTTPLDSRTLQPEKSTRGDTVSPTNLKALRKASRAGPHCPVRLRRKLRKLPCRRR